MSREDIERENARLVAGGVKFSVNAETEEKLHHRMQLKQVEMQCYNVRCLYNEGMGKCGHIEPAIILRFMENKNGSRTINFTCWTAIEKPSQGGVC